MFAGAKIVAVDDNVGELARIVGSLRELGIGCVAYNYPNDIPEDFKFPSIRVIFLDINLIGGNSPGNDPNVFTAPISLIERIISDRNGPYALITWSDTDLHGRLLARIAATPSLERRQPFYTCSLSKEEYAGDPQALRLEVQKIFEGHPPFGALLDWESRVARAGDAVIADIYEHAQSLAGATAAEKLDHMLSRLALASFGKAHADAHRFEAVSEALLLVLGDALNSQFHDRSSTELWNAAISRCSNAGKLSADTRAALNSAVLLEMRDDVKPYRRGAILKLPDSWLKDRSFSYRFGSRVSDLRDRIFRQADAAIQWVLVQGQAACDFNQPKGAPIPYFLAVAAPASALKNKKELPQSLFVTPEFAPAIGLSDQRFVLTILHASPLYMTLASLQRNKFVVLARLRDQLVDAISHDHHSHGSRPGFICFT
jgi:hypothetical protein